MKFGQNLPRNQVPEWASNYINYKGLKKIINAAACRAEADDEVDLAEFFYTLDRNLEDVDAFYNKKYAESARRLKLLRERYGNVTKIPEGLERDEVEDLMGALLELRAQLRKLQWYGEVNRRGFYKITKKLDKKVENRATKERYLATKVEPKAFASNRACSQDMKNINEWLSALSDAKIADDASSVVSVGSMRTVSSRAILNLPAGFLDTVDQAIKQDDERAVSEMLQQTNVEENDTKSAYQRLLLNFLQRAISCKSYRCIAMMLVQVDSLDEDDDLNQRNCLHRLVISISRAIINEAAERQNATAATPLDRKRYIVPAEMPTGLSSQARSIEGKNSSLLNKNDESVKLLVFVLDRLGSKQRSSIASKDAYGRVPLHYAAQYGFVCICDEIIKRMQRWGTYDVSHGIDGDNWQDEEGFAPLHLAVMNAHPLATQALLSSENWQGDVSDGITPKRRSAKSGSVFELAAKANSVAIVKMLIEAGVDVNYQDEQGETALHIAARFDLPDCVTALLHGSDYQRANTEVLERTFGWTPLFVACVEGNFNIVELLIDAGADVDRRDSSGWTAQEHAALRGHIEIAARLAEFTTGGTSSPEGESNLQLPSASPSARSLDDKRSIINPRDAVRPVKTFGHRYLQNRTLVLVSLGSMDMKKAMNPVQLDAISLADAHSTHLDTALSVVVSASGATGEPTVIDLPVQENISTEPIAFTTTDLDKVKILFDIVPTYSGSKDKIVGRGAALLSSMKPSIGSKRISLQGDMSVPIIAAQTLEVIGSVQFNFLVITPFQHQNMLISERNTYWKKMTEPMVIGHRGLGKNMNTRRSLQLGENTIQSFIAAANLGASYVEFDVQLTKDLVPVIYHDFLVSETGLDAPVHTLTLEQFLHVSDAQTPRPSRPSSPAPSARLEPPTGLPPGTQRRQRSYSVGGSQCERTGQELSNRMKHTKTYKDRGWKANTRGNFIHSPFTTLEEMFQKIPESTGFNIEMKYPMLDEAEKHDMDTYAVELNSFVDTVLTKVYDLGKNRNIIFSSFNPDVCLLLSFKQPSIPVLFLTDAGTSKTRDIRASSLKEAVRFASRWNLLGVVAAAEPLVMCPRLVKVVKESGLVCVSYGTLNNENKHVQAQIKQGIDAVIVDNVLAIRKGLTESASITNTSAPITPKTMNGSNAESLAPSLGMTGGQPNTSTTASSNLSKPPVLNRGRSAPVVPTLNVVSTPTIIDTVNGVPIYAPVNGQNGVNGAVFAG